MGAETTMLVVFETKIAGLTDLHKTKLLVGKFSFDFLGIFNPDFNWTQIEVAKQSFGPSSRYIGMTAHILKTLRSTCRTRVALQENNIKKDLARWGGGGGFECFIIRLTDSTHGHAYYTQSYDDCAVICLDSIGEFENLTIWHGKNGKLNKIPVSGYPYSLGLFYSAMT